MLFLLIMLMIYLFFILQSIAFFTLLERHVLGMTQNRFGPKKNSWYGLLQPILDGIKLIKKEQILIFNCTPSIFLGVTVFNFGIFYIEFLTLPYVFGFVYMNWGYLMIMLLLGLNLMCLLMGGIYSKSKYSYLGSMRSVVASVSYEIQFNLNMILFMLYYKSFMLHSIMNLGLILFFFTFFISILVELGRTPFDYSESESDLVSGFNTEYSSVSFVLLFLKEYGSLLFFSIMTSMIFFGGYFLMSVFVFFLIILIRSSYPRYRMDNLMGLMWLILFFHVGLGLYCTYFVFLFWESSLIISILVCKTSGLHSCMFILFFFTLSLFFSSFVLLFLTVVLNFIVNIFSVNLKLVWFYSYLFLVLLFMFFMPSLMLGSVPFIYVLGSMGFILFMISFVFWYISYFGSFLFMSRFHFNSFFVIILLFSFDSFVTLLRPVTLTLRVFINVSLGHFLIMMLHLNLYYLILLVWLIELFVYLVQSYVFMTLSSSYLAILFLALSLILEYLIYTEEVNGLLS